MNKDQNQNNEKPKKAPMKERAKAWWSKHKFKIGCLGFLILGVITAIFGMKAKEAFEFPENPELPDPDEGEKTEEDEEPLMEYNDGEETQKTE